MDLLVADKNQISTLGIGCTVASLSPKFRTPAWRPFRAAMFVGMGLSAVFPVLHGLYLFDFSQFRQQIGLLWLTLQGVLYITGAFLYAVCRGHGHRGHLLILSRYDTLNPPTPASLIHSEHLTKSFMYVWC